MSDILVYVSFMMTRRHVSDEKTSRYIDWRLEGERQRVVDLVWPAHSQIRGPPKISEDQEASI